MPRTPVFDRSRRRAALLSLLLVAGVGLGACEPGIFLDEESILGTWVSEDAGWTVYLDISSDVIGVYMGSTQTCFEHVEYDIIATSGDTYTLRLPGSTVSEQLVIRRSGERLEVFDPSDPGDATVYSRSSQDLDAFAVCSGGGDPSIVCTELPAIHVGGSVAGTLTTSDPMSIYGSHFDLYGLQLTTATRVTIELRSHEIDSYLVVYSAGGDLLDENDDAHTGTFDASLTLELGPGCYRIEATSFDAGDTGAYTLSVN